MGAASNDLAEAMLQNLGLGTALAECGEISNYPSWSLGKTQTFGSLPSGKIHNQTSAAGVLLGSKTKSTRYSGVMELVKSHASPI